MRAPQPGVAEIRAALGAQSQTMVLPAVVVSRGAARRLRTCRGGARHVVAFPDVVACISGGGLIAWCTPESTQTSRVRGLGKVVGAAQVPVRRPPPLGRYALDQSARPPRGVVVIDEAGLAAARVFPEQETPGPPVRVGNVARGQGPLIAACGGFTVKASEEGALVSMALADTGRGSTLVLPSAERVVPRIADMRFIDDGLLIIRTTLNDLAMWDLESHTMEHGSFPGVLAKKTGLWIGTTRGGPCLMYHSDRHVTCTSRGHLFQSGRPRSHIYGFTPSPCGAWVCILIAGDTGSVLEVVGTRSRRKVASVTLPAGDAWDRVEWPIPDRATDDALFCVGLTRGGEVFAIALDGWEGRWGPDGAEL